MKKKMILLNSVLLAIFGHACIINSAPPVMSELRLPSKPFISGDGFRAMADHTFDGTEYTSLTPQEIRYADIVFVKTDRLSNFFKEIHPYISVPYIIITHNSDRPAPGEFEEYLNDPKIIRWFGQNPSMRHHEKFEAIPIGIQNRYIGIPLENFISFDAVRSLKKEYLLGRNFVPGNGVHREFVFDLFAEKPYCENILSGDHLQYLILMGKTKFILSPQGNGLDCHRTWETIIAGAIPILMSSPLDELLIGLPVCIIDDWNMVNEDFLEKTYTHMQAHINEYTVDKVTFAYWEQKIKSFQVMIRNTATA